MCAVVITFPPSKNFEYYLEQFMEKHSKNKDERVRTFAKHCMVKLGRICIKGPRGKVPAIAEIDRAKVRARRVQTKLSVQSHVIIL